MPLGPRVDLTRSAIATAPTKDAWGGARRRKPKYEQIRLWLWDQSQQAAPETGLAHISTVIEEPEPCMLQQMLTSTGQDVWQPAL